MSKLQLYAPPTFAPPQLSGAQASAALALRAYEAVSDAIALLGQHGSLKTVLAYLGGRRRALAVAQGLPHANLYGVFRDAQLDPQFRTLVSHFGPGHAPFEHVVGAYTCQFAQRRETPAGTPHGGILVGAVKARLRHKHLELTQYRCDMTGQLLHNRRWLHTHWCQVAPIMVHAGELFEAALAPVDDSVALASIADLHWWLSHAMPFAFGSMQIAEWLVAYVFRLRGHGGVRFVQNPASLALVAPSPECYREVFAANLQLVATRVAALPVPASKTFVRDARLGNLAAVRRALGQLDVSQKEPTGQTALHVAAREGHSRIVALLLRHGADVHAVLADSGQTPLHLAAQAGHFKASRALLGCGAALHAADLAGQTPLHAALDAGHEAVARLLLSFAAPLGAQDAAGELALHVASRHASAALLGRLIKAYRASSSAQLVAAVNAAGETALSLAALAARPAAVKLLLAAGVPPPITSLGDNTLLPALAALSMQVSRTGADLHLFGLFVRCQARHLVGVADALRTALVARIDKAQRPALKQLLAQASVAVPSVVGR